MISIFTVKTIKITLKSFLIYTDWCNEVSKSSKTFVILLFGMPVLVKWYKCANLQ